MADYATILGTVNQRAAEEKQNAVDLTNLYFAMGQNASAAAEAESQGTTSFNGKTETVDSAKVRLQADLEAQQQKLKAADTIDFNALSMSLLDETKQLAAQRKEIGIAIQEKASVSFFDDPFTALSNAFTIPWDQQALDATNQRLEIVNKTVDSVNNQLTKFSDTTDKLKQSLTQGSIDSITQGLANDQAAKRLRAHNAALAIDANGIAAVSQMNHQQLMTLKAGYDIVVSEENRAATREYRSALLAEREAAREAKESAKQTILEDVTFAKEAMKEGGMLTKEGNLRFTDDEIRRGLERKDPFFANFRDRGVVIRAQGRAAHGESPVERVASWQITGFSGEGDVQDTLMRLNLKAQGKTADIKDKTQRAEAAQKILEDELKKYQENVSSGDKTNPLHLPAYEYIATSKSLVANPAYALVKDIVEDPTIGKQATDANVLYNKLLAGIVDRKISVSDATSFMHDVGMVGKEYVARTGKVYQLTGWDQDKVGVQLRPGSMVGSALVTAAPSVVVGGVATGVGAVPSLVSGGTMLFVGNMLNKKPVDVNLLDESRIMYAFSQGLAASIVHQGKKATETYSKNIADTTARLDAERAAKWGTK